METDESNDLTGESPHLEVVARRVVPVGMGVLTWLVVLLAGGVLLSADLSSLLSVVLVAALGVLFVPIYRFRPWQAGVTERVLGSVYRRRHTLAVVLGLFVLVRLPVVSEQFESVFALLLLPLRAVPQVLFSVTVFYGDRVGEPVGQLLFEVGRLYAELLWLYAVGTVIVRLFSWRGERP